MTLAITEAERILKAKFGEPAKAASQYVIGFKTGAGKVLALDRRATETRIWFQPPAPPALAGTKLLADASNGNSNINGPLLPLRSPSTLRIEVDDAAALHQFIDWYSATTTLSTGGSFRVDSEAFRSAFQVFQELVTAKSGHPFESFENGLAAVWESYKPRLRAEALRRLQPEVWTEDMIGSGEILRTTIAAIEIQEPRLNLTNNLVLWQNRFGHANRDHHALLDALDDRKNRSEVERLIYRLYRGGMDEGDIFRRLTELSNAKYPLLAYLFFLKDMDRFMPIQPTGFDRAFDMLGHPFRTLRQCSWDNYTEYNTLLNSLRPLISEAATISNVRLVDAHSFCWILATLIKQDSDTDSAAPQTGKDPGRVLDGLETAIKAMRISIQDTVKQANGQVVTRTMKFKELRMTSEELELLLAELIKRQEGKCALTGIPFVYGPSCDKQRLPSADRIDSQGHYEPGNIQLVCRFVNFWKGATPNDEFERLLRLVQGIESE